MFVENIESGDNVGNNEAVVTVKIGDEDDNPPYFVLKGRQHLVFYVPKTLQAGDPVVNITVSVNSIVHNSN